MPAPSPSPSPYFALVGRPYAFPSEPPASFDCWSLVKHVRAAEGLPCPLPFDDHAEWCRPGNLARATSEARALWRVDGARSDFDMVVLEPAHVGVSLMGGVLHALARNSGVVWTSPAALRRHWPAAEWWKA